MDQLPRELILHIINIVRDRIYICQYEIDDIEDDGKDCEHLKQLLAENKSDGYYYPIRNLYATCSAFAWLAELEYICIEQGEFFYNIISRNIDGTAHGMCYNGCNKILGYSCYNNGKLIKGNIFSSGPHFIYRYIDGIDYYEDENCNRAYGKCKDNCDNCKQLDIIQQQIFTHDPELEKIFKTDYGYDWIVIARMPKINIISQLHYYNDNLKLAE